MTARKLSDVSAWFTGSVNWDEKDQEVDAKREQAAQRDIAKELVSKGVPKRTAKAAGDPAKTQATECVESFDKSEDDTLVLSGPCGTGKSVSAAHWLGMHERGGLFVAASALSAMSDFNEADRHKMKELRRTRWLVVDDIGQEFSDKREFSSQRMADLIKTRHDDMLKTIITTNLTGQEFGARYGERIVSRLMEGGRWDSLAGHDDMRAKWSS